MKIFQQSVKYFDSYDGINDLLKWHQAVFGEVDPEMTKATIAGGAVLSSLSRTSINDIDIYVSREFYREIWLALTKKYSKPVSNTTNATTWNIEKSETNAVIGGKQVQLIKLIPHAEPHKIFATFDFNAVCVALHKNSIFCNEKFIEDCNQNLLNINDGCKIAFHDFNFRIFKYLLYGYKLGETLHHFDLAELAKTMPAQYDDYAVEQTQLVGYMPVNETNIENFASEYIDYDIAANLVPKPNNYDLTLGNVLKINLTKTPTEKLLNFVDCDGCESLILFNKHFGIVTIDKEKFVVLFAKYYGKFFHRIFTKADTKQMAVQTLLANAGKNLAVAKIAANKKITMTHLIENTKIGIKTIITKNKKIHNWHPNARALQQESMLKFLFYAGYENSLDREELPKNDQKAA